MKTKQIPYYNTKLSADESKIDIINLLKANEIVDTQWQTYKGDTTLGFIHAVNLKGVEREVGFTFKIPVILVPRKQYSKSKNRYETIQVPHEAAAYRLLYWYIDVRLKAVKYGLETIEHAFMSHIISSLPDGTRTTFAEELDKAVELGQVRALPQPRQEV